MPLTTLPAVKGKGGNAQKSSVLRHLVHMPAVSVSPSLLVSSYRKSLIVFCILAFRKNMLQAIRMMWFLRVFVGSAAYGSLCTLNFVLWGIFFIKIIVFFRHDANICSLAHIKEHGSVLHTLARFAMLEVPWSFYFLHFLLPRCQPLVFSVWVVRPNHPQSAMICRGYSQQVSWRLDSAQAGASHVM